MVGGSKTAVLRDVCRSMRAGCASIVWLILCALTHPARMKLSRSSCADKGACARSGLLQLRRA